MAESPSQINAPDPKSTQQPYQPPQLSALGDVRVLTLGGSLGTGDSGNSRVQRF
jgi:hypothetical protein